MTDVIQSIHDHIDGIPTDADRSVLDAGLNAVIQLCRDEIAKRGSEHMSDCAVSPRQTARGWYRIRSTTMSDAAPYQCPVCNGRGKVPNSQTTERNR